jgi:hypothetical protein
MKLLVKFNLIYVLVMALGVGVSGYLTRDLLVKNAQEEVLNNARLLIAKANAVRGYTSGQITKLLETQMKYEFLPQSVPSYSAVEVLSSLQKPSTPSTCTRKPRSTPPTRATVLPAGRSTWSTSSAATAT